jgi:hypothetical protein
LRNAVSIALLGCLLLASCGTPGGVQVEGAAAQVTPPPSTPPPPSNVTPSYDAVTLLRTDPKVSDKIKSTLVPCPGGRYPVDARYVDVTNDGVLDLIAAVVPCDMKATTPAAYQRGTLATYVYDLRTTPPVDVFSVEEPGVQLNDLQFDEGVSKDGVSPGLLEIRYVYRTGDRSCCPSEQSYTYYRWNGTNFEPYLRK